MLQTKKQTRIDGIENKNTLRRCIKTTKNKKGLSANRGRRSGNTKNVKKARIPDKETNFMLK